MKNFMFLKNPVFKREINTMFRTNKTFIAIASYGLAMLGLTALILFKVMSYSRFNGFDPEDTLELFCVMFGLQTAIVFLAVPGFSSGSISGERERQTLDLMLLTKMSTFTIVFGKLLSSLLLICIMIIVAMPVYAVVFYYGGVTILDLLIVCFFDFSYAAAIGSLSIFLSSVFKKTLTSTVLSYIILIFYPVALTVLTLILSTYFYYLDNSIKMPLFIRYCIMGVNPLTSFISVVDVFRGTDFVSDILYNSTRFSNYSFKIWHLTAIYNFIISFIFIKLLLNIT